MKDYSSDSRISGYGEQLKEHGRKEACRERMGGGEEEEQWAVAMMSCEGRVFGRSYKKSGGYYDIWKEEHMVVEKNENTPLFVESIYYCMARAHGFDKQEILLRA